MKHLSLVLTLLSALGTPTFAAEPLPRKTTVSIVGEDFHLNGRPTYAGRSIRLASTPASLAASSGGESNMMTLSL